MLSGWQPWLFNLAQLTSTISFAQLIMLHHVTLVCNNSLLGHIKQESDSTNEAHFVTDEGNCHVTD